MIDTIHLLILNVSRYANITKTLKAKTTEFKVTKIDDDFKNEHEKISYLRASVYKANNKVSIDSNKHSIYNPSHTYNPTIFYSEIRDNVFINLSIPKYVFSTNVFQFLSNDINITLDNPLNVTKNLRQFIKYFLKHQFNELNCNEVILKRIDFCYNHIFNSKEDSHIYIKYLSKQFKNVFPSQKVNIYNLTGAIYVTQAYSFKVYHKGAEFAKHDLPKLQKSLSTGGIINYSLSDLIEIANNTIRYELTIRSRELNRIIKQLYDDEVIEQNQLNVFSSSISPVLQKCYAKFHEYILKVSVQNTIYNDAEVYQYLTESKKRKRLKHSVSSVYCFYQLLSKYTIQELLTLGIFSKTSIYKYKKLLIDLDLLHSENLAIPVPPLTYRRYFSELSIPHNYYFTKIWI